MSVINPSNLVMLINVSYVIIYVTKGVGRLHLSDT